MSLSIEQNPVIARIRKSHWAILIFLAAMALRILLGALNNEANDNHIDVVSLILSTNKLPVKTDCWSCYQPKLYYIICAVVMKLLSMKTASIKVMQLINVAFSGFILFIFWRFINAQPLTDAKKLIAFALFSFNPCLLSINIQSTNDTSAIFFGILSVYAATRFFSQMNLKWLLILSAALIAGTLCKASVMVLVLLILAMFFGKILFETAAAQRKKAVMYLAIFSICFFAIVPFAGGYYDNYQKYNSLTISTWEKDKPPLFFEKTWVVRPGLRSMFEGYFSFRYFDMIRQPYINNEWNNYPLHRTSLWSQLYGRTMFLHFDQWPPGWQSQSTFIVNVGRALIILGLVPLAFFLLGAIKNLRTLLYKIRLFDRAYFANPLNYFYLLITLAYLASSVFYCYSYRDFSAMKSIYIFPGLLAYIKMFCYGYGMPKQGRALKIANVILILIILFSITDELFLCGQLF